MRNNVRPLDVGLKLAAPALLVCAKGIAVRWESEPAPAGHIQIHHEPGTSKAVTDVNLNLVSP
jgi:hypothetical protein